MEIARPRFSRRNFVTTLASAGTTLLSPFPVPGSAADPRLAEVLAHTIAVDMHSHVGIPFGSPKDPLPQFDLVEEMKRTGFSAVIQTYEVDSVPAEPGQDYAHNIEALNFEDRLLAASRVKRALVVKDIQTAHAEGQPVIIQSAEGAQFLEGHIERVEEVYRRGLRNLQLVHERDDRIKPLADIYTRPAHLGGLTDFGAEVVKACNRLGIVIDLTHMSYQAVKAALKISTQPALFSHTSLLPGNEGPVNPGMAPRLLTKEQMHLIADAGGVIGIWTRGTNTAKEYVEAIKRVADLIGIDHVGIGTDTDLEPGVQRTYTNAVWKDELRGFFPAVAAEMLVGGFHPQEIAKVGGGNFCRVFGKVTERASRR